MRSELFGENLEAGTQDRFVLQNPRLLRIGLDGDVMARQGSMVAYQGELDFAHQGSGGMGRFLKKSLTGEGVPLMKVSGRNVLAFDSALSWDIKRVEGASMLAGGVFNTVFTGTGQVAITAHGTPVVLTVDAPTYADMQAAVAWSSSLATSVRRTAGAGALIGRGSGEAFQLAFSGTGFVVVQASEGRVAPPHSH